MKKIVFIFMAFLIMTPPVFAQGVEQGINRRISPPLEPQDISGQLAALEVKLIEANREVDFWRNARFYNDHKKERQRKEKLVYWSQKTVEIQNEMTKLKHNRSFYMHNRHGDQRYYYKNK